MVHERHDDLVRPAQVQAGAGEDVDRAGGHEAVDQVLGECAVDEARPPRALLRPVDVLYPRVDWEEKRAWRPGLVDRALAQDLVDRFVAAGAVYVFTGPSLHLRGPRKVVVALVHHDDHMHVRVR